MSPLLVGTPDFYAGTAGTVTVGAGEVVLFITAWASAANATVTIFGRPAAGIPIPQSSATAPVGIWMMWFDHALLRATSLANTIVFVNTAHFAVHTVKPGGTTTAGGSGL